MKVFSKTDVGLTRTENQDTVWAEMIAPNAAAAVLCDGMGGEHDGGLASKMAVEIISGHIKENFSEKMSHNSIRNMLVIAVNKANVEVYAKAQQLRDSEDFVMGTTCVAAIVFEGCAHIINVGDSRAYCIFVDEEGDECLRQITKDHSRVQMLMDRGEITEEEARHHEERSCITRAIGADEDVNPDYFEQPLNSGNMILLCSDGLSSYGDDLDILDICCEAHCEDICETLVRYANNNGGRDNVSVAIITAD